MRSKRKPRIELPDVPPLCVEWWPIGHCHPYDNNPRKVSLAAISAVAGSIKSFGFKNPILVDESGRIIAGHTRLLAAQELRLKSVPVIRCRDLSPEQVRAFRLADNRVAEYTEWDTDLLKGELAALADFQMDWAGFDQLMESLVPTDRESGANGATTEHADEVPEETSEIHSRIGSIYELGPHRLFCGDSTIESNWEQLLGKEIGDAVMTDPPYGIDYVGGCSDPRRDNYKSGDRVENDGAEELPKLLDGALGQAIKKCKDGGVWYVMAPAGTNHVIFSNWLNMKGILHQVLIWNKDRMVFGRSDYHYKHEFIYYGWKPGAAHCEPADRTQVTVWDIARPTNSDDHPTMKPVELFVHMMKNSTMPGQIILEPFAGSGTTIIAAAMTGRVCRAMEIAPRYCDAIRRRWTKLAAENKIEVGSGALE